MVSSLPEQLGEMGRVEIVSERFAKVVVDSSRLRDVVSKLLGYGWRYVTSIGIDTRILDGWYRVLHLFTIDAPNTRYLAVETRCSSGFPKIPSITVLVEGADWSEREIRDLLGIDFVDHPVREPLIARPELWKDLKPLRKDVPYNEKIAPRRVAEEPPKGFAIAVGPYHPALHEPECFELVVDGERIVDARYRGFMVHRGIEKLAEERLDIHQIPFVAERICGICGFTHSTAYCQAIEDALKIDVPERALFVRSILLEIERIHSHLLWFGVLFHVLGLDVGFATMWRIRENVMDLAEVLTGNRKTYGMNIVGGVRRDIPDHVVPKAIEILRKVENEFRLFIDRLLSLPEVVKRTREVGILTREEARKLCVVGPVARASGIAMDVRRDKPYAAYRFVKIDVPTYDTCDVYARALVRRDEVLESIRLAIYFLENLPRTPLTVEDFGFHELREGIGATEAPRGENVHYVMTGLARKVYRWRVRAPSYANIPSVLKMLIGEKLCDAPAIIASIDPCFSCTDRIVVIDRRYGTKRILRLGEAHG